VAKGTINRVLSGIKPLNQAFIRVLSGLNSESHNISNVTVGATPVKRSLLDEAKRQAAETNDVTARWAHSKTKKRGVFEFNYDPEQSHQGLVYEKSRVTNVLPGSQADKHGVQVGWRILKISVQDHGSEISFRAEQSPFEPGFTLHNGAVDTIDKESQAYKSGVRRTWEVIKVNGELIGEYSAKTMIKRSLLYSPNHA